MQNRCLGGYFVIPVANNHNKFAQFYTAFDIYVRSTVTLLNLTSRLILRFLVLLTRLCGSWSRDITFAIY